MKELSQNFAELCLKKFMLRCLWNIKISEKLIFHKSHVKIFFIYIIPYLKKIHDSWLRENFDTLRTIFILLLKNEILILVKFQMFSFEFFNYCIY